MIYTILILISLVLLARHVRKQTQQISGILLEMAEVHRMQNNQIIKLNARLDKIVEHIGEVK